MGKSKLSEITEKWKLHYRDCYEIDSVLSLFQPNYSLLKYQKLLQRPKKIEMEQRMSQDLDNVYPVNPSLQRFDKVKIVSNKVFSRCKE